jgi:hypothetical protein
LISGWADSEEARSGAKPAGAALNFQGIKMQARFQSTDSVWIIREPHAGFQEQLASRELARGLRSLGFVRSPVQAVVGEGELPSSNMAFFLSTGRHGFKHPEAYEISHEGGAGKAAHVGFRGATPQAVLYAVFDFLERQGAFFGLDGEVYPLDPAQGGGYRQPHLIRDTSWYTVGLLLRDQPGDRDRAIRALNAVLDQQIDGPGERWHGTFYREAEEPRHTDEARPWHNYDPNRREFIGTTFEIILLNFGERLPNELNRRMEQSIRTPVAHPWSPCTDTSRSLIVMRPSSRCDRKQHARQQKIRTDPNDFLHVYPTSMGAEFPVHTLVHGIGPTSRRLLI